MNEQQTRLWILAIATVLCVSACFAEPVGTAFVYEGYLSTTGSPANDTVDFIFKLYEDPNAVTQIGSTTQIDDVFVSGGEFSVQLDFGLDAFNGQSRWLVSEVQGSGDDRFTRLTPHQKIMPTPYAIYAEKTKSVVGGIGIEGAGTTNYLAKFTGTDLIGDSVIYENAGDVGIGTMTPSAKLHVNGSLALQNGSVINEISTDGTLADNSDSAVPTEQAVKMYVNSQISGGSVGVVPVGGVVAWMKSFPSTPALPSNFVECNGQTLSDAGSPYNGQTIPNLNGSSGTHRFLRGSAVSGATGGSETHSHGMGTPIGKIASGSGHTYAAAQDHHHSINSAGTLPSYYEVVWIMRVK